MMNKEFRDWLEDKKGASIRPYIKGGKLIFPSLNTQKELDLVIEKYDELHKLPVIPQWVADGIESKKRAGKRLNLAMSEFPESKLRKELGIDEHECNELYARAWLNGYTVAKESLYYALIKGHELSSNEFKYWSCKAYNSGHLFVGSKYPKASCINRMTKDNWNELGINDSNADFVKADD